VKLNINLLLILKYHMVDVYHHVTCSLLQRVMLGQSEIFTRMFQFIEYERFSRAESLRHKAQM
jgi:hypothetical protein